YTITAQSLMWNSGVVAIPKGSAHYLANALEACDAMCQSNMRKYFIEQFALGLALESSGQLYEAKEWFLHYWGNKLQWQEKIIEPFLHQVYANHYSVDESIGLMRDVTYTLPAVKVKKSSWFKKLFHAVQ